MQSEVQIKCRNPCIVNAQETAEEKNDRNKVPEYRSGKPEASLFDTVFLYFFKEVCVYLVPEQIRNCKAVFLKMLEIDMVKEVFERLLEDVNDK